MLHDILSRSAVLCAVLVCAVPGAAQLGEVALPDFDIDLGQFRIPEGALVAPFTFRVPVRIEQLHRDVVEARLRCLAHAPTPSGGNIAPYIVAVGQQEIPIDVATGSFQGTVTVQAWRSNAESAPDLVEAHRWWCQLHVRTEEGSWRHVGSDEARPVWARNLQPSELSLAGDLEPATTNR